MSNKKPKKGILKNKGNSNNTNSTESPAGKKSIAWDEVTIEMHDAERGTRQKISEPKTPYHHQSWDSGELTGSEEDSTNKSQNSDEHIHSHDKSVLSDPESFDVLHSKVEQQAQLQQEGHKLVKSPRVVIATEPSTKRKSVEFSSSDEEPQHPSHEEFIKKRKQHYDEFRRLKELRAKGLKDEADDDDDNDST
jgi:protein phosphatase inhibitor 2